MIERRLKLAKKLLNPKDSVLIVTIDELEYLHLGMLLEQMFPEAKMQMVTNVISGKGVSLTGQFSRVEEYIYILMFGDMHVQHQNSSMLDGADDAEDEELEQTDVEVEFIGLRRRNTTNYRTSRPNQFYPFFVDKQDGHIVCVGDAITPDIDRTAVLPPDGCVAIWPLDPEGRERIWGLVPESARKLQDLGCLKIGSWNAAKQTGTVKYWASGNVDKLLNGEIEVTERDIIDEWCREFYFEGRRRSDLIRFGMFTSGSYLWDWKGGSYAGNGVSNIYNLYPIPARILNGSNMHQNPGY